MRFNTRLFIFAVLLTLIGVLQYSFGYENVSLYNRYIFQPFQAFRNWLLKEIPFSVGDLLYIGLALLILYWMVRVILSFFRWKEDGKKLHHRLMQLLKVVAVLYIWFFMGWGGNYFKPNITSFWYLDSPASNYAKALYVYDSFLVHKLNELAPHYQSESFEEINRRSVQYFTHYTEDDSKLAGLHAKPSLFGEWMQNIAVQGYYNPFTGEAQVNDQLPAFMLPFVICHEMAHQSGIANESDANLLAYALGTSVNDSIYNYSAYFNLWLYTNNRMRSADTALAIQFENALHTTVKEHLETLRILRKRYRSPIQKISSRIYDRFLKYNGQDKGLNTYSEVVFSAWQLEERRRKEGALQLRLP